jgi:hypothetical protein
VQQNYVSHVVVRLDTRQKQKVQEQPREDQADAYS